MPKIADVKSNIRSKRKPLRDVSNGGLKPSVSSTVIKKSNRDTQQEDPITTCGAGECRDPLDRLLLVHSDLSVLIHQIDELVVQALEQKATNKKEIESFAHVLTEMQTSLKPWISRFQKVLLTQAATESKNQPQTTLATKKILPSINKDIKNENPETYKLDFMVSPSPLVSWHADCTQEGAKNLFMLTPLPKPSAFSSKLKKSSKSVFKNEFLSPEKSTRPNDNNNNIHNDNTSIIVSTPYLKMSPPKSCIFLEPGSKGTKAPKIPGGGSEDLEPSSSQPFGQLGLKYPELFGIRPANNIGNVRKVVEESPNWRMSPPKTCVVLEPSDDHVVIKDVGINLNKLQNQVVIESTPMCKDLDTTVLRGKRAGENTLKKELWMRFEAAAGHEFGEKAITTTTGSNKGFMELLEEVSLDD